MTEIEDLRAELSKALSAQEAAWAHTADLQAELGKYRAENKKLRDAVVQNALNSSGHAPAQPTMTPGMAAGMLGQMINNHKAEEH